MRLVRSRRLNRHRQRSDMRYSTRRHNSFFKMWWTVAHTIEAYANAATKEVSVSCMHSTQAGVAAGCAAMSQDHSAEVFCSETGCAQGRNTLASILSTFYDVWCCNQPAHGKSGIGGLVRPSGASERMPCKHLLCTRRALSGDLAGFTPKLEP